jgi:nucleoporin NUP1
MSGYSFDEIPSSPRKLLSGAARPSGNPRIHAIQKPYSRPVSYSGPSSSTSSPQHELLNANGNVNGNGNGNGSGSPTKPTAPTTRPALLTSQSHRERAFPRSGSESSLFGSLKGLISKPLSWLATPRGSSSKRDQSTWNAGLDSEDPESPSVKKLRRVSPVKQRGAYDPPARNEGMSTRGKDREILPPLPALAGGLKKLPTTAANAVGSLPHSQSMPYLDPPSSALSPARRKQGGAMTRSRGMNLASLANEEEDQPVVEDKGTWSPWKQQAAAGRARTPVRQNRGSISEVRDVSLSSWEQG